MLALMPAICAGAQTTAAPQAAAQAFQKKFPAASAVQWEEETKGVFEADFKLNGTKMSACFDANGNWLETETAIKKKELPEAVRLAIAKDFADYEIEEAEKVDKPEGIAYEVELEKEEGDEETVVEALYSADGKLLKQTKENEEADDDDEGHD